MSYIESSTRRRCLDQMHAMYKIRWWWWYRVTSEWFDVPAEHAEDEIHDEEWTDDDEADEVDPWPGDSHCVVDLPTNIDRRSAISVNSTVHDVLIKELWFFSYIFTNYCEPILTIFGRLLVQTQSVQDVFVYVETSTELTPLRTIRGHHRPVSQVGQRTEQEAQLMLTNPYTHPASHVAVAKTALMHTSRG